MSKPTAAEIARQVEATRDRGLLTLPDSWREEGVAERMGAWIERNVPINERLAYCYGR